MARIPGADPARQSFLAGWFTRIVYSATRRKLGKMVEPASVTAHHTRILWGYGQMEQSLMSSHLIEENLKELATLRTATLVGCPFWIDIGSAVSRKNGISQEKIEALADYATSAVFSDIEKLVLAYADCITRTPAEIPDILFDKLRRQFSEAQMVELTATIAWENYRARFNHAFGIESANFSEGAVCALPAR
jgi:alkylhydroperoxidase family enzyme